jgi:inhibitor of cysteine peptidase
MIIVSDADNGREVNVPLREQWIIKLPENPTTGVRWQFENLDEGIDLVQDSYESDADAAIGAASVRVFTLQCNQPGRHLLQLKCLQEWEAKAPADAEFQCTINCE